MLGVVKERVVQRVVTVLDGFGGDLVEARALCDRATAELPAEPELLIRKAKLEIGASEFAAARENLRQLIELPGASGGGGEIVGCRRGGVGGRQHEDRCD